MKKIPLTQGQIAIVDDIDADLVKQKWCAVYMKSRKGNFAAAKTLPGNKHIYLHRVIMERVLGRELDRNEFVNPVNNNPLDCRRENLRLSDYAHSARSRRKQSETSSRFKGVSWHKRDKKWLASIGMNGKQKWLGYFDTEREAANAYEQAAKEMFGDYANADKDGTS